MIRTTVIALMVILCILTTSCTSAKPYVAPSDSVVEEALDGGEWGLDIPVPQFIDKMDNKYYSPDYDSIILEFYEVDDDDVQVYANKLKSSGFDVNPIIQYLEGREDIAEKRAKAKAYNAYEAQKGDYSIFIDLLAYSSKVTQIRISGATNDEMQSMNIEEDNIDSSGELVLAEKYLTEDITDKINARSQGEDFSDPEKWNFDIPAPNFISKTVDSYPDINGTVVQFESVSSNEFMTYLSTLKENGYKIELGVSYTITENAQENSSLYASNRDAADRAKEEMENGFYNVILVSDKKAIMSIDIMMMPDDDVLKSDFDFLIIKVLLNNASAR